jgi:hypothetical protein
MLGFCVSRYDGLFLRLAALWRRACDGGDRRALP